MPFTRRQRGYIANTVTDVATEELAIGLPKAASAVDSVPILNGRHTCREN